MPNKNTGRAIAEGLFIIIIAIIGIAFANFSGKSYDKQFVNKFNNLVPEHLQCETVQEIEALSGYVFMNPEQQAFLWKFADKYNLTSLPKRNQDNVNSSDENYQALVEIDEYLDQEIKAGNMTIKQASEKLQHIFAINNSDVVTLIKT